MFNSYLAEFSAAWNVFIRIPLPAFLRGEEERSEYPRIDGHPALLRPMLPLIGALLGLFPAVVLWALHLLPGGRLTAGIAGAVLAPLILELMTSWAGLNALSSFLDLRRQGASLEEAFQAAPASMNTPRPGASMLMLISMYLLRILFFGVLAVYAPFWFIIALTLAWTLRAELATVNPIGTSGRPWLAAPRGFKHRHWQLALGVMVVSGFTHPFAVLLAFGVAWALAWLAKNMCLDSISGVNRQAFDVLGYTAELILLFLGVLLFAAP